MVAVLVFTCLALQAPPVSSEPEWWVLAAGGAACTLLGWLVNELRNAERRALATMIQTLTARTEQLERLMQVSNEKNHALELRLAALAGGRAPP